MQPGWLANPKLNAWWQTLQLGGLNLLFPPVCLLCGTGATDSRLCSPCRQKLLLTKNENLCRKCGSTVGPHLQVQPDCTRCRDEHFGFTRTVRLGRYDGELRRACLKIKQFGGYHLIAALAELAWNEQPALADLRPDLVVPVPLHWQRRIWRGYDQTDRLAQCWAERWNVPVVRRAVARVRATRPQSRLTPTERRTNLVRAFAIRQNSIRYLNGRTIVVVDDVMTTGATVKQVTRQLLKAGAAEVRIAVLARGEGRSGKKVEAPRTGFEPVLQE